MLKWVKIPFITTLFNSRELNLRKETVKKLSNLEYEKSTVQGFYNQLRGTATSVDKMVGKYDS